MTMLDAGTELDLTVLEGLDFDTPCMVGRSPQTIAAGRPECPEAAVTAWKCRGCGWEFALCQPHAREFEVDMLRCERDPKVRLLRTIYHKPKGWTGLVCTHCEHDVVLPLLFVPIK